MIKKTVSLLLLIACLGFNTVFGATLVSPKYDGAQGFNGLLAPVKVNGLYGFIDREGETVVEPQYTAVDKLSDGYFKVRSGSKWGAVNHEGKLVVECLYDDCSTVISNGLWVVSQNGKWGAVSMDGTSHVPCMYDYVGDFTGLVAPVSNGGYWTSGSGSKYKIYYGTNYGYINNKSEIVIGLKYEFAAPFKEGRARVRDANGWKFIDENDVSYGGYYEEVRDFSEGLAAVTRDGKWGYVDINGNEVIGVSYLAADSFSCGVAVVGEIVDGVYKEGVIDTAGNLIVPFKYDSISAFSDNAAVVENDEKYGYIDKLGNEFVPVSLFKRPFDFSEGVGLVKGTAGDKFVNIKGETILDIGGNRWGEESVSGGIAVVSGNGGKYGYVKVMPGEGVRVMINGMTIKTDQPAIIINDRTMVPLRVISENMGAVVRWDETERKVYITKGDTQIMTQIGNHVLDKNGTGITLDAPPVIVNDRTLVPIRAIVEGLGAAVEWDGESYTVLVSY